MYIAPGQGLTIPLGWNFDVNRNILSLRSFVASFKKIFLKSDFIHFFFHDFIHVYSPGAGADSPQGTKFDFNRNVLSLHSFVASFKKYLWNSDFKLFFFFFFSWFNTCIEPRCKGRQLPGDKILMLTERPYHFTHLLQISKKSLWSLILYNCFHDLIHIYSPGAGGIQPLRDKVLMSTGTLSVRLSVTSFKS